MQIKLAGKILLGLALLSLLVLGLFFAFRNTYLSNKVKHNLDAFNHKNRVNFTVGKIQFTGLKSIEIKEISLVPNPNDTLLWVGSTHVSIDFWAFLTGQLKISNLELNQVFIRPRDIDGKRNFGFLFAKDSLSPQVRQAAISGYSDEGKRWIEKIIDLMPTGFVLNDLRISGVKDEHHISILIRKIDSQKGNYDFWAGIYENGSKSYWHFIGKNDRQNKILSGRIIRQGESGRIPGLFQAYQLATSFRELSFDISVDDSGNLGLNAKLNFSDWSISHWRIAPKPILIPIAEADFRFRLGGRFVELDSASVLKISQVQTHPYLRYSTDSIRNLTFKVKMPETPSQDFFDAIPKGLFSNLDGIQTTGDLAFHLHFSNDLDNPKNVVFDAGLDRKNFKIKKMGATNLALMSSEFTHTAYEQGQPIKTFKVGAGNPNFVPLEKISPLLQQAILSSEDGSFFWHTGFNMETFQSSITANLTEKRFVRGASTISMQLVKNVFLTRNKTIARKLEEIMIVWLIENLRLTSKERMFEVYLNIIEFGPEIYGIGPASQFYFNKSPGNLTINESIFLSSIVPSPKWFKYRFDAKGNLKHELDSYFRVISGHLVRRGIITDEIRNEMLPGVTLTGPAKNLLNKGNMTLPDSVQLLLPDLDN